MTTADVALDGLAVARLTKLVIADRITDHPRRVLVDWAKANLPEHRAELVEYLSGCPWCIGMYVGLAVTPVRHTRWWRTVRYPLALSAIAGIVGDLA